MNIKRVPPRAPFLDTIKLVNGEWLHGRSLCSALGIKNYKEFLGRPEVQPHVHDQIHGCGPYRFLIHLNDFNMVLLAYGWTEQEAEEAIELFNTQVHAPGRKRSIQEEEEEEEYDDDDDDDLRASGPLKKRHSPLRKKKNNAPVVFVHPPQEEEGGGDPVFEAIQELNTQISSLHRMVLNLYHRHALSQRQGH